MARKWTPICPQPDCGSVRVHAGGKTMRCEDCAYEGPVRRFNQSANLGGIVGGASSTGRLIERAPGADEQ